MHTKNKLFTLEDIENATGLLGGQSDAVTASFSKKASEIFEMKNKFNNYIFDLAFFL
jgi:hypothetical protein